ncbi:MAG: hypothetical protein ACO1OC_00725 [Tuberibacillus sp.]
MKWAMVIGISFIVMLLELFSWTRSTADQKKEKIASAMILAIGWIIAVLLVFFPDMPGPTQLIAALYRPLMWFME